MEWGKHSKGATSEADLPTEQYKAETDSWFQGTNANQRGASCFESQAREGKEATRCVTSTKMEQRTDRGWPKELRLRRSQDFRQVYDFGRRQAFRCVVLVWMPGAEGRTRVGLATARSLGTHVRRNRARRRLREILRCHKESLPQGTDIVFIARPALLRLPFDLACQEVLGALTQFSAGNTE